MNTDERIEEIIKLRESGMTYGQIGARFMITSARASQLYHKGLSLRIEAGSCWDYGLSTRAKKILRTLPAPINSKQELRDYVSKTPAALLKYRNLGKKTLREIIAFSGHQFIADELQQLQDRPFVKLTIAELQHLHAGTCHQIRTLMSQRMSLRTLITSKGGSWK